MKKGVLQLTFLEKLDYLMEKNHLNKRKVSLGSGIPYSTIDAFYKVGYNNIKLSTFRKLCDYFGVSMDSLARDDMDELIPFDPNMKDFRILNDSAEVLHENVDKCNNGLAADFLSRLDLLMADRNLNKRRLSDKSGIPYTTIVNWYKRGYDNMSLSNYVTLCNFFNVSLDFLAINDKNELKDHVSVPYNHISSKSSVLKVIQSQLEHFDCLTIEDIDIICRTLKALYDKN